MYLEGQMSKFLNIKVASKVVKTAQTCVGQGGTGDKEIHHCSPAPRNLPVPQCFISTVHNTYVLDTAIRYELPKRKMAATAKNKEKILKKGKKSSLRLEVQGDLAKTIWDRLENSDSSSFHGSNGLACRAVTNSLATPDNLVGKNSGFQVLARHPIPLPPWACPLQLQSSTRPRKIHLQTWLSPEQSPISPVWMEVLDFFSDLKGWKTSWCSILPSILVTGQHPDLVLLDRRTSPSTVHLVELKVPRDSSRKIEAEWWKDTHQGDRIEMSPSPTRNRSKRIHWQ